MEAGQVVDSKQLVQRHNTRALHAADVARDPHAVPTRRALVAVFRQAKEGKAPSQDGIPYDLFKVAPHAMARVIHPLVTKAALQLQTPL
eukprot:3959623-Lingulodinium_polyedra.AAC.1